MPGLTHLLTETYRERRTSARNADAGYGRGLAIDRKDLLRLCYLIEPLAILRCLSASLGGSHRVGAKNLAFWGYGGLAGRSGRS